MLRWCLTIAMCCCLAEAGNLNNTETQRHKRDVVPDGESSGEISMEKKSLLKTLKAGMDDLPDIQKETKTLKERYLPPENNTAGDERKVEKSMADTKAELDDLSEINLEIKSLLESNADLGRRTSGDEAPTGMQFVGTGYNILTGNPDGGRSHNGGIDPGFKTTRKHLKLTYTNVLADGPKEVDFAVRSSCVNETTTQIYHGTKSYQKKFSIDVTFSASGSYGLADYAFSASAMYAEAKDETINTKSIVRDENTVCNRGRIRVKTELAEAMKFSVDDTFAAAVCALPTTYNKATYMSFLDKWGTHTTFQIELGNKIVRRKKTTLKELFKFAMTEAGASISAEGSYGGYSGSLSLNMEMLQQSESFSSSFKSSLYTFTLGSESNPQPIGFKLEPLPVILKSTYWQNLGTLISQNLCPAGTTYSGTIQTIRTNIEQALKDYPQHLHAQGSTDLPLKIPRVWPIGTYSLPESVAGCPYGWLTGWRYHDTEDSSPANYYSNPLYVKKEGGSNDLKWFFCTKTSEPSSDYAMDWPAGEYCIMKKGNCPRGFTLGELKWDDEDDNNRNSYGGTRPDGQYGGDTIIYFCCRDDGYAVNPIYLPTDKGFLLFQKNRQCQQVYNMNVRTSYIRWDDEDSHNSNHNTGSCPFDDGGNDDHKLHFCYYTRY